MKLLRTVCGACVAALLWITTASAQAQTTLPHARVGQAYAFQVSTTPAAPAGTIYAATGLPAGLSINGSSGLISGTPNTATTTQPVISLTSGGITNSFTVTLIVDPAAGTPSITSGATASATAGQAFSYTVTADNSPTSFNVGALPAGLTFNSPSITGTPATSGTYSIALSANNASGTGATKTLTLTVAPAGPVPAITSATSAAAALNAAFTYQIQASNTPTSFQAIGLPLGLSTNAATGVISGTPTVAGVYAVTLTATNANGTGAASTLTLTVGALSTLSSAATATFTVGSVGTFQLAATNAPLSFNVTGLPPGLTVNTATGLISGTATTAGNFTVSVSANNATGTGPSATLALVVSAASSGGSGGSSGGSTGGSTGGSNGGGTGTVTAPVFTQQPSGFSVNAGNTVTLSAAVAGTGPITYQWSKDGTAIAGATAATYTFTAQAGDGGAYTLAATNAAGTTVSNAATVVVISIVTTPTLTTQPRSQTIGAGGSVTLTSAASGAGLTYQWKKDGVALAGATNATLTLTGVTAANTGHYTVTVTNTAGSVTSTDTVVAVLPTNAQVMNLSTRGVVGTGDKVLIAGFVVTGSDPKPVLIRAVGPTLSNYGLGGLLADPVLELRNSASTVIASNDNWGAASNATAIASTTTKVGGFALPTGSTDAVILTTLQPGLYTATVRGANNTTGVALVEIYDASEDVSTSRLINVSSRADVGTGGNVLIAGFVVTGTESKRVLVRAAGPSLTQFGVTTALADSKLQVVRDGAVVAENDDWGTAANAAQVAAAATNTGAFTFGSGSRDSALLLTLAPGAYTAVVSGAGTSTGTALVEVYEVP